jgi:hypothetical protein
MSNSPPNAVQPLIGIDSTLLLTEKNAIIASLHATSHDNVQSQGVLKIGAKRINNMLDKYSRCHTGPLFCCDFQHNCRIWYDCCLIIIPTLCMHSFIPTFPVTHSHASRYTSMALFAVLHTHSMYTHIHHEYVK